MLALDVSQLMELSLSPFHRADIRRHNMPRPVTDYIRHAAAALQYLLDTEVWSIDLQFASRYMSCLEKLLLSGFTDVAVLSSLISFMASAVLCSSDIALQLLRADSWLSTGLRSNSLNPFTAIRQQEAQEGSCKCC